MKLTDIEQRARAALGIARFNAMQRAAVACKAPSMILLSPTGSGKTLAFAAAVLMRLPAPEASVMAVVIAPSRELVMQIQTVVRQLAPGYKTMAVYGGNPFDDERKSIASAVPQILIATPGRLLDHLNRRTITLGKVRALVVDEYDKTLELGFHDEVRRIAARVGRVPFTVLTSATAIADMPPFIHADKAETIDATDDTAQAPKLTVVQVPSAVPDKLDTLAALLRGGIGLSIVFVNHRESAERVVNGLRSRNIPAVLYHGGLEQQQREMAVAAFRAGAAPVLVATDLAARGLDIQDVDAIVHYHLPVDQAAWTHRNGRTARAGKSGSVYVITGPDEVLPDYIAVSHPLYPDMDNDAQLTAPWTLLYINAGKQLKISRGDIAGFIIKKCGARPDQVGTITVAARYSLVAVAPDIAQTVMATARTERLKNTRVKITGL